MMFRLALWLVLLTFLPSTSIQPACRAQSTLDRADRLVRLVERRLELSVEVARSKWNSGRPIDDPQRERELLDRLVAVRPPGLDEERVRAFFGAQIEASKQVQRALHEQWRAADQPPFADAPDLARLRPELDQVSLDLLRSLAELPPSECVATRARTLWGDEWSQPQKTALQPLFRLSRW